MPQKKKSPNLDSETIQSLYASPEVMTWMSNEKHHCIYASPSLAEFMGVRRLDLLGVKWVERTHPDDRERCRRNQMNAALYPGNFRHEYRVLHPDGKDCWAIDMGIARFDRRGRFRGYVGIVSDITAQKKAELHAKGKQRRLERQVLEISDREQGRIGRDLHDGLSQRLLAVSLHLGLLEKSLRKKAPAPANQAKKAREGIQETIRQVREISRTLAPVSLGHGSFLNALEELAEYVRGTFGIKVQISGAPEKPAWKLDASVHLYRIIQEAITNAIRHGKAKQIRIAFEKKGGEYRLKITDNGKGLPAKLPANGMGLATMRYRAELLEGHMQIKHGRPKGAEIHLEFASNSGGGNKHEKKARGRRVK